MALTNLSYSDDTYVVSVRFNGALTTAYVSHIVTGLHARGNALHFADDRYDQTFGSDLAIARAKERLYNKLVKRLTKGVDHSGERFSIETSGENLQETVQNNEPSGAIR